MAFPSRLENVSVRRLRGISSSDRFSNRSHRRSPRSNRSTLSPFQVEDTCGGDQGAASRQIGTCPGYLLSRLRREEWLGNGPESARCSRPTAHYPLPTAHCPQLTAHCPQPTAHYSLPQQDADASAFEIGGDDVEFGVAVHVGDCESPNPSSCRKR